MFTGIVRGIGRIEDLSQSAGNACFAVVLPQSLLAGIETGASVSIDGVCLTAVRFDEQRIWFEAIEETLKRTTLKFLSNGQEVNVERAARFSDEIGGHLLSGHIFGTASIVDLKHLDGSCIASFRCPKEWMKYFFTKGYIALNGVSLTLVDVDESAGMFTVHLIPETLKRTTFGAKNIGDLINIELDSHTQAIVDTVERLMAMRYR